MAKVTDSGGRPFSGIVPTIVVGIVTDNVDPDELGRVKVKFPTLDQAPLSFWLRQVAPNAGKERGLYALPETDDEVMVMFMQGAQDAGVIIGQFWNGMDLPPQEAKDQHPEPDKQRVPEAKWSTDEFTMGSTTLDANDRRFWNSRSGHLILFDDTEGKESVQIWDKEHALSMVFDTSSQRIIIANTEGDLHIRTKRDLYLEAGRDLKWRAERDIVGESNRDTTHHVVRDWKVDVDNTTTLTTRMAVTLESTTADLTCKSKLTTTCEGGVAFQGTGGSTALLESKTATSVKGGMVLLN
jgi:uncharacterized protein involved in type VI secretion and phage assembly